MVELWAQNYIARLNDDGDVIGVNVVDVLHLGNDRYYSVETEVGFDSRISTVDIAKDMVRAKAVREDLGLTLGNMSKAFESIALEHDLKPRIMRDVMMGLVRGLNGTDIAEKNDYHKNTINKYKKVIREEFTRLELLRCMAYLGLTLGGFGILADLRDIDG